MRRKSYLYALLTELGAVGLLGLSMIGGGPCGPGTPLGAVLLVVVMVIHIPCLILMLLAPFTPMPVLVAAGLILQLGSLALVWNVLLKRKALNVATG